MNRLTKATVALATLVALSLCVFALAAKNTSSSEPQDGPIIIKGGSLTIQCSLNDQCFTFNTSTQKFEHKDKLKKVTQIIVKDESGKVIADLGSVNFPNGKPSVEIFYKSP